MSMVINSNIPSVTAQRHLAESRGDMETSMERLASGKRINSAMDDAAGLAITHKLDSKITGLNQGIRNANDGISMLQTAEGALEQVNNMLDRMKELATQASNGTYTAEDRDALDAEFQQLSDEITRIAENTDFNNTSVVNSTATVKFHVGDTNSTHDQISIALQKMDAGSIGSAATTARVDDADLQNQTNAIAAMDIIDDAIADVDSYRSTLGSVENRLDHTVSNLMNRVENQAAARSRIEDADFAVESASLAKNQVLQQAGTAMLAQANQAGQGVLALIR